MKYLIEDLKCDPFCKDNQYENPCHKATQSGHLDVVNYLQDNIHFSDRTKEENKVNKSLHLAARNGNLEEVTFLINVMRCDPNCANNLGRVPLHYASENGHLDVVKYLVDTHHCDPQVKSDSCNKVTPLHLAAESGHLQQVQWFIDDMNCDPNCKDNWGEIPLHYAS